MPVGERIVTEDGVSGCLVRVKAVPGAKRDEVAGALGDRLKVRVSAPPEGGKANRAICALLAGALGVRERDVEIVAGASSAEKGVRVAGVSAARARAALGLGAPRG